MAYSKTKSAQLRYLFKKYYATSDPEEQIRIKAQIRHVNSGRPVKERLSEDDKISWKRQYSRIDEQKKRQGISAHDFMNEWKKNNKD